MGVFGVGMWSLSDSSTWKAAEIKPLEELEAYDMEISRVAPTDGPLGSPSLRHLGKQYSFATGEGKPSALAANDDLRRPSTAPDSVSRVLQASFAERLSRVGSMRVSQR